jgi:hypothetical protein
VDVDYDDKLLLPLLNNPQQILFHPYCRYHLIEIHAFVIDVVICEKSNKETVHYVPLPIKDPYEEEIPSHQVACSSLLMPFLLMEEPSADVNVLLCEWLHHELNLWELFVVHCTRVLIA